MAKRGKSRQQAKGRASSAKRSSPKRSAPAKAAPRAGSVAAKRAAGTNKAAQNRAAQNRAESPPSAPRPGSVAANRAAGTNKAAQNKALGNNVRAKDRTQEQKENRRQGRQDSYNSQDITQTSDFDFADRTKKKVGAGEIRHLRKEGHDRESIQQAAADSGLRIGKNTQKRFDRWDERRAAREKAKQVVENPVKQPVEETANANVEQEPNTTPVPKPTITTPEVIINKPVTTTPTTSTTVPSTSIDNEVEQSQDQTVSQDNDINSNVTGDNNNVNISQDNSVRQYGGINKSFIYNSTNGNNYMDTPVSAATMGGYFHDEDTPGRSASFVDRYQTMNRDYQKQFSNTNFAQQAITKGAQNTAVDIGALDQRVNDRAKLSRARSTSMAGDIFGDMFNYTPQEFQARKPEDEEDTNK